MTVRRVVAGVVTAVVLLLSTGCHRDEVVTPVGQTSHPASWGTTPVSGAASKFHNPVDILRRTTCTIPASEKTGQPTPHDGGLGYLADCYWGVQFQDEYMTLWRYPSRAVLMQSLALDPYKRRDGETFIMSKGPDGDWYATVYAFTSADSVTGPPPATVARQLGGTIS